MPPKLTASAANAATTHWIAGRGLDTASAAPTTRTTAGMRHRSALFTSAIRINAAVSATTKSTVKPVGQNPPTQRTRGPPNGESRTNVKTMPKRQPTNGRATRYRPAKETTPRLGPINRQVASEGSRDLAGSITENHPGG